MNTDRVNWARNIEYAAARVYWPRSVDEICDIVRNEASVKALGTRHSFNRVADSDGSQISTGYLNNVLELDREKKLVRVEAGIRYGELSQYLDGEGFALHNLASLPHISVAGACMTATHGSGVGNRSLASSVAGLTFVTADGSLVSLSRDGEPDEFEGAVVSLGALGVVTEMTLNVEEAFRMVQVVYDKLPFDALEDHFDEIMSSAYSVSLFTHWTSSVINQVWVKRRESDDPTFSDLTRFGATMAAEKRSPLPNGAVENCTDQLSQPGPWWDRLPHFRLGFTPSSGEELQTEYFVPREDAWKALQLINTIREQVAPILLTTEVRTIAADSYWLSPCFERDSVAIHFTWKQDWERVGALLPQIESLLAPFGPRPHWGKLSRIKAAELRGRYPKLPKFLALADKYDPYGKFRNSFLEEYVFGSKSS